MRKSIFSFIGIIVFTGLIGCGIDNVPDSPIGNEETKEDEEILFSDGILPGQFSVSLRKKVQFSIGNLRHNIITNVWSFAPAQYDFIGKENEQVYSGETSWMDMFLWGSSGFNGTSYERGYLEAKSIYNTLYDWGVYNKISNGGDVSHLWRTLQSNEWDYIINKRTNCYDLLGRAMIAGSKGWIILPDDWEAPSGITFKPYVTLKNGFLTSSQNGYVEYSLEEWYKMEMAGAVFLPVTGYMYQKKVSYYLYNDMCYWTSTYVSDYTRAYAFNLSEKLAMGQKTLECIKNTSRQVLLPVRLVIEVQ